MAARLGMVRELYKEVKSALIKLLIRKAVFIELTQSMETKGRTQMVSQIDFNWDKIVARGRRQHDDS